MKEITENKIYQVNHSRKGIFTVQITRNGHEWVDAVILEGMPKYILDYNQKYEGDSITIRKSLCTFMEISESD